MYSIVSHIRPNKECPFEQYLTMLERSGAKKDATKIRAAVGQLQDRGAQELAHIRLAEKMNDVWQLRPQPHRIFFFFDSGRHCYVLLHGFRKKTRKTPSQELEKA